MGRQRGLFLLVTALSAGGLVGACGPNGGGGGGIFQRAVNAANAASDFQCMCLVAAGLYSSLEACKADNGFGLEEATSEEIACAEGVIAGNADATSVVTCQPGCPASASLTAMK